MQTRVNDQPAYILHRRDWRNSSLILDLLTLDYGRISLLAKSAKSGRSAALLQPFYSLSVSWSGHSELKTLVSVDGVPTAADEKAYLPLLYINELLSEFLPRQEAMPEVFDIYSRLLNHIDSNFGEMELRKFERSLMKMLGYLPDTGLDATQGEAIVGDRYYQFVASSGFIRCAEEEQNAISGETIIAWNQQAFESKQVLQLAKSVMRCIIDFNLHGKKLKSRDIYQQIKSRL